MTDTKNTLKVLSLNVYYGEVLRGLLEYLEGKAGEVSVMCFQETNEAVRPSLDSLLSEGYRAFHATKPGINDTHYVSMYIKRDLIIEDYELLHGSTAGVGFAQVCRLRDSMGNPAVVTNVYGVPKPGHKLDTPERLLLSRAVLDAVKHFDGTQIIAGDFNLMPETDSVRIFEYDGFHNLIDEFKIPTTRNQLAWRKFPPHMRQLFADYTFVRGDNIEYNLEVEDVVISDHLPMMIEVREKVGDAYAEHTYPVGLARAIV